MLATAVGRVFRVKLSLDDLQRAVLVEAGTFAGAIEAAYPHLRLTEEGLLGIARKVSLEVSLEPSPI